jgi:hypothetical protein
LLILIVACHVQLLQAQVLPDDRADALYHSYDGGGIEITGPSLLIRKKLTNDISAFANYYVDSISSASIDVLSYASPYDEERTEVSVGGDYLLDETILSAGYTNSDENDFQAQTVWFGVSQDIFGGLTTVNLGYARGWDTVEQVTDPDFSEDVDRRRYRVGVGQVLTKNLIMNLDFETITDEGFLNNPYRQVRFLDASAPAGFLWQPEVYPNTRTSTAFSVGARYFMQEGSAVYGNARIFSDTWGVDAWNTQVGYVYSLPAWLFDLSFRYYSQTAADFYSDLFAYANEQNFLARDKELSSFSDYSVSLSATYAIPVADWGFVERGSASIVYDYFYFDYDDFRNVLAGGEPGSEPLYNFSADVIQLYVSFWF